MAFSMQGELNVCTRKNEAGWLPLGTHENQLQQDLNERGETVKLWEENRGDSLHNAGFSDGFYARTLESTGKRENKLECVKVDVLRASEDMGKGNPQNGRKHLKNAHQTRN